jgi:hypothetical protein
MIKKFTVRILEKQNWPSSWPTESTPKNKEAQKEKEVGDIWGEIWKINKEVLSTISNRDFLRVERNSRLEHITNPSQKATELKEGSTLGFTFTFNGKLNQDLFLRTTAGQVIPEGVTILEAYGTQWTRNGITGEFFTEQGNRLIIREWSNVSVKKIMAADELKKQLEQVENSAILHSGNKDYDIIQAALMRNIPADLAVTLFTRKIGGTMNTQGRKNDIEEVLTEFERTKDYFYEDFGKNALKDSVIRPEFIAYYANHVTADFTPEDKKTLGITEDLEKNFSRKVRAQAFAGFKGMEELSLEEKTKLADIPTDILTGWGNEAFWKKFTPWSKECQQLFTCAAVFAWLPSEWGTNESLHRILSNESAGIVGRVNYKLVERWIDGLGLKRIAQENTWLDWSSIAGKAWVVSTAVWLGQLTLSNEKYLPHGRDSIGVPLEEAIGMLRYIKDRYGSPEVAGNIYWKTWMYTHAITGQTLPKQFQEWY